MLYLKSAIPDIPGFPPIPDWVDDLFGEIGDFVNPLEYLAKALRAVYGLMAWFFETVITHPIRFSNSDAVDYLYGNMLGLALALIAPVVIVLMCLSIFRVRFMVSFLEAILIGIILVPGYPLWFEIIDKAVAIGDDLSKLAMFYDTKSEAGPMGILIDAATAPILMFAAFLPSTMLGGINVLLVYVYEALIVLVKGLGLPLLVLRPLHPRIARFSDWTIAAGFVAMVAGRPIMVLCIEIAQVLGDTVLGGTTAGTVFFLNAGFALSLWLQFKLYQQASEIVGKVTGRTRSSVTGKVESTIKNKPKVSVADNNRLHAQTVAAVPVPVHTEQGKKSIASRGYTAVKTEVAQTAKSEARKAVRSKTIKILATVGVAAATGGTSAAATAAAASVATNKGSRS
jgi:hypothetical protein